MRFIRDNMARVKVRPDHKIVYMQAWGMPGIVWLGL